jgi:pimeloyl-[acyl-carrier protein] methyl ester esterase
VKAEWIIRRGRKDLLLFFNGWGMDRRVADWLVSAWPDDSGRDIAVLYDYRDLSLPAWLGEAIADAGSVDLVAWSLGVWAASNAGIGRVGRAVAINGTPTPVDAERGIPPEIFCGTLESWNDANRKRFERRMMGGVPPEIAEAVRSHRAADEQQAELRSIGEAVARCPAESSTSWKFSIALIGERDLIFSPDNQRRAWREAGVPAVEIAAMPHFPFTHIAGWRELLA